MRGFPDVLYLVPQLVRWQELMLITDVSSMHAPHSVHLSITTLSTLQWLLYLVPQLLGSQEPLVHEVLSTPFTPRLSSLSSAHFNFMFTLVTMASLVSTLPNILAIIFTHPWKVQSKNEDISSSQTGTPKTSKTYNTSVQWCVGSKAHK